MVQPYSRIERDDPLTHNIGAYYGLHFPIENVSQNDQKLIQDYLRSILPTTSTVPYAETIWKFDLSDDGTIRQVPQRRGADPDDLPNPYPFSEVYDHFVEGLAKLPITPPPPERYIRDVEAWHRADTLDRQIREARQTWKGRMKALLASVGLADGDPEVVYPPYVSEQAQMSRLQSWIDERLADGTLVTAIVQQLSKD